VCNIRGRDCTVRIYRSGLFHYNQAFTSSIDFQSGKGAHSGARIRVKGHQNSAHFQKCAIKSLKSKATQLDGFNLWLISCFEFSTGGYMSNRQIKSNI
jgi:hypothetical protein